MAKPEELMSQPPAPATVELTMIGQYNTYQDTRECSTDLPDTYMGEFCGDIIRDAWKNGEDLIDCVLVIRFR